MNDFHELPDSERGQSFRMPRPSGRSAFASYILGGFECSAKLRPDGQRLDLIETTGHGLLCRDDYEALIGHGIRTARDGVRWHLIESAPAEFDWSSVMPMLRAARESGIQVIWDLCHYGWPSWLDVWSPEFVAHFVRFATQAATIIRDETGTRPFFCPINEISYWAWAVDKEKFEPRWRGRGGEFKRQLVKASIAAIRSIRQTCPEAGFICAEPLIHVAATSTRKREILAAESRSAAQFEALDMLTGRARPELGGSPDLLDVVGVNFYPDNQWYTGGSTIPLGHHAFRPLREMLREVFERYRRPLMISETGAENTARPAWLHYVCGEATAAQRSGVPMEGVCIYPIVDYPGWFDDRHCEVGLLSSPNGNGHREVDKEFAAEVARQLRLHSEEFSEP